MTVTPTFMHNQNTGIIILKIVYKSTLFYLWQFWYILIFTQILSTFFSANMPFLGLPYLTVYHCILYISCKRILSLTKFIFVNTTYKFIYYHSLYFNIMHMYILYLCNLKCIADNICMLIYTLIMFVYI